MKGDVLINIAGRSVNCRYTAENRRAIYDSRIRTTERWNEVVAALRNPPRVWLNVPAPAWLIEIGTFLLRTESELVLKSRRVVPGRLLDAGFAFQFPDWPEAARELVSRWRTQR